MKAARYAVLWAMLLGVVVGLWAGTEEDRARLRELRREVARHDELYFRKAAPEISDAEYDALKRELRALESRLPEADAPPGGVPGGVGDDRSGVFPTARHVVPMGSLEKAHTDEELLAFHARAAARLERPEEEIVYWIEPKYDGLAASLTYERGRLVRVVTRGDGAEGDDVTENARALLPALPERLGGEPATWPARVELRGEIFMGRAEFARVNAERIEAGETGFAHPRNLAVGTLRSREADEVAGRRLELVCFGWGAWEGDGAAARPETLAALRATLAAWGLPVVAGARVATGREELLAAVAALRAGGAADGFPTDGVVVKLERVADQLALGDGAGGPRWAVARKFDPESALTRLLGITWQVGRGGTLTPVAELAPVELAGSTVARATLHNADEIARRDLRIGDLVRVVKAGEIIPAIIGVDHARRDEAVAASPYGFPDTCPACATPLARVEGRIVWRCANADCPARAARRLEHYASTAALDVSGLGPALIEALVARGLARRPADLHRLGVAEWRGLPGVGAKRAEQLVAALAAARQRANDDGARLVLALGLPGVGRETARKLARSFPGLPELGRADAGALRAAGLSEAAAQALAAHLAEPARAAEWADLMAAGVGERWRTAAAAAATAASAGPFTGQSVAFTGRLTRWTRAEAGARLRAAGAEVDPDLTRGTTLLVVGEEPGAKLEEARRRGIEVIDETELARRLGAP